MPPPAGAILGSSSYNVPSGAGHASPAGTLTGARECQREEHPTPLDDEGISAKKFPIIENGVLRNFYIDTYYGRKLGMKATTGGRSNLVFQSESVKSVKDWMAELGRGIYITGFLGGNSNSATGDFSTGVQGFLFENGERGKPLSGLNIAGNHLEFWKGITELGDDPYPHSPYLTPSMSLKPMMVAGK